MKHGWFEIAGLQTGEHTLKNRIRGLNYLIPHLRDSSILDVGSAEGLLGSWLHRHAGAKTLHCLEMHDPFIETGMECVPEATFFKVDLNYLAAWMKANPGALLPGYKVVLCMCIAQKMGDPAAFLKILVGLCQKFFVLHLPAVVIEDERSGKRPLDTKVLMKSLGFKSVRDDSTPELTRFIYKRLPRAS